MGGGANGTVHDTCLSQSTFRVGVTSFLGSIQVILCKREREREREIQRVRTKWKLDDVKSGCPGCRWASPAAGPPRFERSSTNSWPKGARVVAVVAVVVVVVVVVAVEAVAEVVAVGGPTPVGPP